MKNPILTVFLSLFGILSFAATFGQEYYYNQDIYPKNNIELGITLGANNFLGDLGGNIGKGQDLLKDYTFKTVRPLLGVSLNYYPLRWLNINTGINFTSVTGADSLITNENGLE